MFSLVRVAVCLAAQAGSAQGFLAARPTSAWGRPLLSTPMTIEDFFGRLAPLGKGRFITMRPDLSVILEATVDLSAASVACKAMPSGKTLVTVASADKSFECHLDVAAAAAATLGTSAKTGGPIVRLHDAAGATLCTVVVAKEQANAFDALRHELGDNVPLAGGRAAAAAAAAAAMLAPAAAAVAAAVATVAAAEVEADEAEAAAEEVPRCRLVTGEELELELADLSTGPVLLDAFATWCGPCQLMVPVLDEVARALASSRRDSGEVRVLKFDTDEHPDLAARFRIGGLPTLLFLVAGNDGAPKVVHRFEGAAPAEYVLELAEHHFFGGPKPRDVRSLMQ